MSGKKLPPPKSGAGLSEALRSRHSDASPAEREDAAPARSRAAAAETAKRVRRSWYLSESTADALAEAVEDLHFATRKPKNVILDALIAAALEHRDDVAASLTDPK